MARPVLDVGYSFFQSETEIPRKGGITDIAPNVHKIHAVDGRYMFYNGGPYSNFSTDNSVKLLEKIPNCEVYFYTGMQFRKRQVYLDAATDCDFLLVLDTDEYLHYIDWDIFYSDLEWLSKKYPDLYLFGVNIYFHENYLKAFNQVEHGKTTAFMRLIRNPWELEYDLTHYTFVKKGDKKHNWLWGPNNDVVKGMTLATDSSMRDDNALTHRDYWAWDNMMEEKRLMMEATANGEMQ